MSSANGIVQYLLDTRQQTAVGIGHLLQALLNAASVKPARKPLIIVVEHTNKEGATRVMMFSRQKLTVNFSNAVENMKRDLGVGGYYNQVTVTITGALFYNEDGTVQETPVLIAQESWADLMPLVHKIFIRST